MFMESGLIRGLRWQLNVDVKITSLAPKREPPPHCPHLVINRASSDVSHTLWSKLTKAFKGLLKMLTSKRQVLINVTEWSDTLGSIFTRFVSGFVH